MDLMVRRYCDIRTRLATSQAVHATLLRRDRSLTIEYETLGIHSLKHLREFW